jgi:hypothetical protein
MWWIFPTLLLGVNEAMVIIIILYDFSLNDFLPFMQKPLGMYHIRSKLFSLPRSFNGTFCYIDDVLSLNNSRFWWFCWSHLSHWAWNKGYHIYRYRSASYLYIHLEIDSEGRFKKEFFTRKEMIPIFLFVNFSFICSNIPATPAYGVYLSQLIRYLRACGSYQDILDRGLLLIMKIQNQGFLVVKLSHRFENFAVATMTLLTVREYLCHKWSLMCSVCRHHNPVLSSFVAYHRVYNRSKTTGATCEAGTSYPSRAPESTPVFIGVGVSRPLIFSVVFYGSLFVLFLLVIALSVLLRYTASGIFNLFLNVYVVPKTVS